MARTFIGSKGRIIGAYKVAPPRTITVGGWTQEAPTGVINGTNRDFTLSSTPTNVATVLVFLNGLAQSRDAGNYTLSGNVITFATDSIPRGSDQILVLYM